MWFDRYPVLRRVMVNTKTGKTFRGVLWRKTREWLVLREAELLEVRAKPVVVDGEVLIERANVDFVQVVG